MSAVHNLCIDCGALIDPGEMLCGGCGAGGMAMTGEMVRPDRQFRMEPSCLTARDYGLIEAFLAERAERDPWMAAIARAKLATARIAAAEPGMVTLNSRMTFRIDGGTPQQRTLVHWEHDIVMGRTLSVATPLGLALLGMRVGESAVLHSRDGSIRQVVLKAIEYQPEAVREAQGSGYREVPAALDAKDGARPRGDGVAHAPQAAEIIPLRPRRPHGPGKDWPPGPGSPGPSAA